MKLTCQRSRLHFGVMERSELSPFCMVKGKAQRTGVKHDWTSKHEANHQVMQPSRSWANVCLCMVLSVENGQACSRGWVVTYEIFVLAFLPVSFGTAVPR